jgi:hypothetical protein
MRIKRKIVLLSSCALLLQNMAAVLPAQAFDNQNLQDMTAFVYWKLPLGGEPNKPAEPTYGFSVGETHESWLFGAPEGPGTEDSGSSTSLALPMLFDLHFGGSGDDDALPSLSLTGVDVVAAATGKVNAADEGMSTGEIIAASVGGALVVGGGVCAAVCNSHHHHPAAAGEGGEGG